jgi:hypothetical protein
MSEEALIEGFVCFLFFSCPLWFGFWERFLFLDLVLVLALFSFYFEQQD